MRGLAALLAIAAATGADAGRDLAFVACPIYRDTDAGRKSGCWLADDGATGVRYDVTSAPTKPDWNHAVLVEGRADAKGGNPCGGIVLDPVRVAVLDEPCTRFMLEGEGYAGRRFALPTRNVRPLYEARPAVAKPWAPRRFELPFDFDSHFVTYQLTDYYIDAAIDYALAVAPARIAITGYADTAPQTVSGQRLAEPATLARERAELVERAFTMRGVPAAAIDIAVAAVPAGVTDEAFDGLAGPSRRRVEVTVTPVSAGAGGERPG